MHLSPLCCGLWSHPPCEPGWARQPESYAVSRLDREEILERFERSMMDICGIPSPDARTVSRAAPRGALTVKEKALAAGTFGDL